MFFDAKLDDGVNRFFSTVLNLLRLRAGPQDLPDHRFMTALVIVVYVSQAAITAQALSPDNEPARSVIAIAIQFLAIAVLLRIRRHPERLQQTLLAFTSTGIVISLLAFLFLIQADPNVNQPLLALVWFAIFGWSLAVDANIFRHALGIAMPIAMLVTVVLLAVTYVILDLLFR